MISKLGKRITSRNKGFRYERDLARTLWEKGFACVRGPASGSGVKNAFCPDLIALKNGKVFIMEVKGIKEGGSTKVSRDKLERLIAFAKRASGNREGNVYIFIALKLIRRGWRFLNVRDFLREEGVKKVYTIKYTDALNYMDLKGIVGIADGHCLGLT